MAITPQLLIEQVRSAVPFVFEGPEPAGPGFRYLRVLRGYDRRDLGAPGYLAMAVASHLHLTTPALEIAATATAPAAGVLVSILFMREWREAIMRKAGKREAAAA